MRTAIRCQCGNSDCNRWFVHPEVWLTEDQATQVAILLDTIDRERDNRSPLDAFVADSLNAIIGALHEHSVALGHELSLPPNSIVPVRADVLSAACVEIKTLRKQVREMENKE